MPKDCEFCRASLKPLLFHSASTRCELVFRVVQDEERDEEAHLEFGFSRLSRNVLRASEGDQGSEDEGGGDHGE